MAISTAPSPLCTVPSQPSARRLSTSRPGAEKALTDADIPPLAASQLQQWIDECGRQLYDQPLTAESGAPYHELTRKLWACWKHHWLAERQVTEGGRVDGMRVARRIRDGQGLNGGSLGGDVVRDLVWADGVLRGDPRAVHAFFQHFDDFAVAIARKTSPPYARKLDWWEDLKSTLVVREGRAGKLANYRGHSGLKAWLGRIFVREIVHYAERERRETTALEAFSSIVDVKAVAADRSTADRDCRDKVRLALRDALASLEPAQRQALLHHFVDELENQDSAKIMGVAPGTATRRRDRGLASLRDSLLAHVRQDGDALSDCLKHRLSDEFDLAALCAPAKNVPRPAAAAEHYDARSNGTRSNRRPNAVVANDGVFR